MLFMMAASSRVVKLATERVALYGRRRIASVGGAHVERPSRTAEDADALLGLSEVLRHHFHRRTVDAAPASGGWWILAEVEVEVGQGEMVRSDLVGWRRSLLPDRPRGRPVRSRPDWACDVLLSSNARSQVISTLDVLRRHEVPHYWLVDPEAGTLTAYRWTAQGYCVVLQAHRWQIVRVEPFDAIEIRVGSLFGDDLDP